LAPATANNLHIAAELAPSHTLNPGPGSYNLSGSINLEHLEKVEALKAMVQESKDRR
jgi:hypothetical protein